MYFFALFSSCGMKVACSLVIAILFVHLLCEGSCLADAFNAASQAQPPCHKHAGSSSDETHNPSCTQGPVSEGKIAFQPAAVLPVISATLPLPAFSITGPIAQEGSPGFLPSAVPNSILRI